MTDDEIDVAAWAEGKTITLDYSKDETVAYYHGHMLRDYNSPDNTPEGFEFITNGHKPLFAADTGTGTKAFQDVKYDDYYDGPGTIAKTTSFSSASSGGGLWGNGGTRLRLFYVARPTVVYFNVIDSANQGEGYWNNMISYPYLLASDVSGTSYTGAPYNNYTTPYQGKQTGVLYPGQQIQLPQDTTDVVYDQYSLIGWALKDEATTKDTDTKDNFKIRDQYYEEGILYGVTKTTSGTMSTYSYSGVWVVPNDIEDVMANAPVPYNQWAVYGMRAQMLYFVAAGPSSHDEKLTYYDPDETRWVTPELAGEWATDNLEKKFQTDGQLVNLGDDVAAPKYKGIPDVDDVVRQGYKLIGWTTDPTNTSGLKSTSHTNGAPYSYDKDGVTVYEIDYRNHDDAETITRANFTMPTGIESALTFYAVYEPIKYELRYNAYTADSPEEYVVVNTQYVYIYEMFDAWWYDPDNGRQHYYDPNLDDDPSNDYLGYVVSYWADYMWGMGMPLDENMTTQDVIDGVSLWEPWNEGDPINVYAELAERKVTVIFDGGGSPFPPETKDFWWSDYPGKTTISYPGYEFQTWWADMFYFDFIDDTMTIGDIVQMMAATGMTDPLVDIWTVDEITIYAEWVVRDYVVTFHYNFPGDTSDSTTERHYFFDAPIYIDVSDVDGYTFDGWYSSDGVKVETDSPYSLFVPGDGVTAIDMYAQWVPISSGSGLGPDSAGDVTVLSPFSAIPAIILTDDEEDSIPVVSNSSMTQLLAVASTPSVVSATKAVTGLLTSSNQELSVSIASASAANATANATQIQDLTIDSTSNNAAQVQVNNSSRAANGYLGITEDAAMIERRRDE